MSWAIEVSLRYMLASWLGLLPTTVFYVYVGTAAKNLTALATGQAEPAPGQSILFVGGLVMAGLATFVVARIAQRALKADLRIDDSAD